jgi:beta-glucosidase
MSKRKITSHGRINGKAKYLDSRLPLEKRIGDLISRLTLEEKAGIMTSFSLPVPRLGLPAYRAGGEALHGLARRGRATVFPQAIGLAATFDPELVRRAAAAAGDEARAKFNAWRKLPLLETANGLNLWAPNVNIFRDPRWGRGQETFGEDPVLSARMGAAFVTGLQGNDPHYLKTASGVKHYAVHSGPEKSRHEFDARISAKDLHETYLPAFKACVEAGAEIVMAAYSKLNGESCCASPTLIADILRGQWKFDGHVTSDGGGLMDLHHHHKVTADEAESAAFALRNGCDLEAGMGVFKYLPDAVKQGLITEQEIDTALFRSLRTRFRLGLFDPPSRVPYHTLPANIVGCDKHRDLAYEAAAKSLVLLKNSDEVLPLRPEITRILVTGPNASDVDVLIGNYFGLNERMTTILEGIVGSAGPNRLVLYHKGVTANVKNANFLDIGVGMAHGCEAVIAVMGLTPNMEGEEFDPILSDNYGDRTDLAFPPHQVEFVKKLIDTGKPVILVVTSGSPVVSPDFLDAVQAVVYAWYPGQEGGRAVGDLLFGRISPSGRLPVTAPRSVDDLPAFDDYRMINRTYRYMEREPYYPFGFGLGYTRFKYGRLTLDAHAINAGASITAEVDVQNLGKTRGDEVVQLYISDLAASVATPQWALKDFKRVSLKPRETKRVRFLVRPEMMSLVGEDGVSRIEPGEFRVIIGGACPSPRSVDLGAAGPVQGTFRVR